MNSLARFPTATPQILKMCGAQRISVMASGVPATLCIRGQVPRFLDTLRACTAVPVMECPCVVNNPQINSYLRSQWCCDTRSHLAGTMSPRELAANACCSVEHLRGAGHTVCGFLLLATTRQPCRHPLGSLARAPVSTAMPAGAAIGALHITTACSRGWETHTAVICPFISRAFPADVDSPSSRCAHLVAICS